MWISPAMAADGAGAAGGAGIIGQFLPLILIMVVFYFLLIRPQMKRAREHRELVAAIRRGDTVVTAGGMIGKVAKVVDDNEIDVDFGENVRIRVIKSTISDVRNRTEPVKSGDAKPATKTKKAEKKPD
ncbi:MAG: preprotein translocase subunit YajC [Pseudomonadota bacterium]